MLPYQLKTFAGNCRRPSDLYSRALKWSAHMRKPPVTSTHRNSPPPTSISASVVVMVTSFGLAPLFAWFPSSRRRNVYSSPPFSDASAASCSAVAPVTPIRHYAVLSCKSRISWTLISTKVLRKIEVCEYLLPVRKGWRDVAPKEHNAILRSSSRLILDNVWSTTRVTTSS